MGDVAFRAQGFHAVDLSELAFRLATISAFREAFKMAKGVILEPIMNVEVVAPVEFQSKVAHLFRSGLYMSRLLINIRLTTASCLDHYFRHGRT